MYNLLKAAGIEATRQVSDNIQSHQITDVTPTGPDLVSLPPFQDMIENPILIKNLLEQQGVTGIEFIEPTGKIGGGSNHDTNYKGYI
jgi:hypothetical protein